MKLTNWKEPIAAAGVILSLSFVGYEVRQNSRLARGQARQELAALNQEWLVLHSTNVEFNDLWTGYWFIGNSLSSDEIGRARFIMRLNLRRLENVYFQYTEGLVDQSALNSYGFQISNVYQTTRFRDQWANGRRAYDPDFVRFFEERIGWIVE